MLHTVAGMIVGGEVNQEGIRVEFRRSPHRRLGAHYSLDVAYQRGPLATFISERMNHNVIRLAGYLKVIDSPVGSDLCWRIDHDVPIGKLPFALAGTVGAAVNDAPVLRWFDYEPDRVLFVIDDIHEDATAVEVCVSRVELRKGAREIVAEDLVAHHHVPLTVRLNTPRLLIHSGDRGAWQYAVCGRWTSAMEGAKFLNI